MQTGQPVTIFGDDYPTPDGTCIRDYIHVNDLAQAHILAVEYLLNGGASEQFNVGTGTGHSVLEMVRAVEAVTGQKVPYVSARGAKAIRRLWWPRRTNCAPGSGWKPQYTELRTIVEHAWNFARKQPAAK